MAVARQRIHLPPAAWRRALAGWLGGRLWAGGDVERFERLFADTIGVPHAVAAPSGRAALRFIFEAMRLEPGSEVICSAYGYPIVPHLVRAMGLGLRFADCELQTLGMDPEALETAATKDTRLVIATHLFGVPCRIREIMGVAGACGADVVEDCAHCFGASVGATRVGSFGRAGYFSFETSKVINTMGGGMVTTRDGDLARRLRELAASQPRPGPRWLARRLLRTSFESAVTCPLLFNAAVYPALRLAPRDKGAGDRFASGYQGDEISTRGKMSRYTNYQAGLGLSQAERIGPRGERREVNARRLIEALRDRVAFQEPAADNVRPDYMLVTARFDRMPEVADALLRAGVDTKHHYMRDCSRLFDTGGMFPNAARAEREVLHLPAYPELSPAQIDRIARQVDRTIGSLNGR